MHRRFSVAVVVGIAVVFLTGASAPSSRSGKTPAAPVGVADDVSQPKLAAAPLPCRNGRLDARAATSAYLATIPPDKRARSDAYFEGGYWLILWDFLASAAVYILLLATGWSVRMRDWAEGIPRFKPVRTFFYWLEFMVVTSVVLFPLNVYEGYFREHQYGLATQTFGPWFGEQLKSLGIGIVFGGVLIALLYGIVRRTPRRWWLWGSVTTIVFLMFFVLISPLYVAPLFNRYTPLQDPALRESILGAARANGIPASEVYVEDASRQSTRISAHVDGFWGTERVVLNDNLLKRCSGEEILAVMGHEMGHYVLHHVYGLIFFFGLLIVVGFVYLCKASAWALARWGDRWGTRDVSDVAALPVLALLISLYFFILTPVANTFTRTIENEADIFGLNAAREPDGAAQAALKVADYRKLNPDPLEEFLFYDHPSGRERIYVSMRWKAENTTACREVENTTIKPKLK
jgi:STE24 endopeptidase